jgi:hypothetical protein
MRVHRGGTEIAVLHIVESQRRTKIILHYYWQAARLRGAAAALAAALLAFNDVKDALKAAHQALLKTWGNSTASAEQEHDKNTLKQRWENNVQKVPNASQEVIVYCACLLSSPYISSLPSPPPVYFLPFTLHTRTNGRYHCFHTL